MCPSSDTAPQTDIDIIEQGVLVLLKSLNHLKGTGPENLTQHTHNTHTLSHALLKSLVVEVAPILTLIFKHSINTSCVPSDWKTTNFVPIFKKSDSKPLLNYLPISIARVPSRLIEHVIANGIREFLNKSNLLNKCQHGFRKLRVLVNLYFIIRSNYF